MHQSFLFNSVGPLKISPEQIVSIKIIIRRRSKNKKRLVAVGIKLSLKQKRIEKDTIMRCLRQSRVQTRCSSFHFIRFYMWNYTMGKLRGVLKILSLYFSPCYDEFQQPCNADIVTSYLFFIARLEINNFYNELNFLFNAS